MSIAVGFEKPCKGYIVSWVRWTPGNIDGNYPPNLGYCIRGFLDPDGTLGPKLSNSIRTSLVIAERTNDDGSITVETLNSLYIIRPEDQSDAP